MLKFLSKFIRIKTKELEAKLRPNANCSYAGVGEIEVSYYADNTTKIELSIKHSRIPSGKNLEFYADGKKLGEISSQNGFGKSYLELKDLNLDVGSSAEIRIDGSVQYEGEFRPD